MKAKGLFMGLFLVASAALGANLIYNQGPVIHSAHVVFIFWGPTFNDVTSPDYSYARELQNFRNQFGTTPEYANLTQYNDSNGPIASTNLGAGTADWFDTTTPLTNVSDSTAQAEVSAYLATHAFDDSAIYEVVLPSTSYWSLTTTSGTLSSCGGSGTTLACGYHSFFTNNNNTVKYSVQPYESCGGCQVPGWTDAQNEEHSITHETREAVSDPLPYSGWTTNGNPNQEADDQCNSASMAFIGTGGYGYQPEWSNELGRCTPKYEGYHEVANCRSISGWAWDRTTPRLPIGVDVYRDSTRVATALANLYRSDLAMAGIGDGYHAFTYAPDLSWKDSQWHSALVRFGGTSTNLTWSPRPSFICNVSMFPGWVPQDDLSTGGQVYTVATQFSSSKSGYVTQLGFYRAAGETGSNTLSLWADTGGSALATQTANCGGSGWCWVSIPSPGVAITPNTLYRVSVNTNTFQAKTYCGIGSGITNQVLTAHQGFWVAGSTFPTTGSCSNFFVDVKFDM